MHVKVVAAFVPATAKAPAASGWAGEAHTVQADRTAPRLAAHGAVPARATHPALTQHVAERHTQQVAQQGALAAWLTYAEQLAQRGSRVVFLPLPQLPLSLLLLLCNLHGQPPGDSRVCESLLSLQLPLALF